MKDRASATWTVHVDRSPQEVFDYLGDVRRVAEWSPKAYRVEGLAEGPVHQGTTFTSYGWLPKDDDHRNDVEITECVAPSRLKLVSRDDGGHTVNTYVLTPDGQGTRVDRTMDLPRPAGFQGAIFPMVVSAFIKPGVGKGMKMFKSNLEGAAG